MLCSCCPEAGRTSGPLLSGSDVGVNTAWGEQVNSAAPLRSC